MSLARSARVTALAVLALPLALDAQQGVRPAARVTVADYLDWEDVSDARLSPDGKQVLFTRRTVDKVNDKWDSAIWLMNADGTRQRLLVQGSNPRWSPDGTKLLYIADGKPSGNQLWVRFMDAEGAVTQLTRLTEAPTDAEWSPDGTQIAFRMSVPKKDDWRIAMPAAPKGAKWTEPPRVVTKLEYRRDRQGFTDDGFQHVFVVGSDGGVPRQLTTGDWNHGAPEWMPDGKSLVFSALRTPEADYAWRESDIYKLDVATGTIRALTTRKGPDANPVPSPDGRWIAYTGYDSTDATWQDAALHVMDAEGGNVRVLTAKFDRTPQGIRWSADGRTLWFSAENEGYRHLYAVNAAGGDVRAITSGKRVLNVTDIGRDGTAVGIQSTALEPNDVVRLSLRAPGEIVRLTRVNDDVLAGKALGQVQELWFTSPDGVRTQGWLVTPPDFQAGRTYPLMLEIHGGPHAMYNGGFSLARQEHVANGYVLLYTNPRGSTGYGSAFGNAIKNAYPGKDFDDLMAAVDTVVGRGIADPNRLYVFGCSGGGVLTSWIVGHTDRFAAASANCPVTNWLSFVGTTDGASWYRNFAKLPWEDPSEHLRRSPLMYVGNVKTPTMLMTGVQDLRTPMPQTEEYYQALRLRKVPTAMIRFNNEWHGTSSTPSNWLRTQLYLRSWFEKWQGPAGTPRTTTVSTTTSLVP
ncbi:MAG: S9 family peptidase [Gemmatimonadaceae bacterium]|nr:S9 family peptidase [Gemmatimonadaceae bacterium]